MTKSTADSGNGRASKPFDVARVRHDFPILHTQSHGRPLVYLDNGATTQKPQAVIDRIGRYYRSENANIHRGVYELSQRATAAYEDARRTVARFINAREEVEIVFTRGTTESVNLVAAGFRSILKSGDEIILTQLEHHSNIVPWQLAAEATGATIKVIPISDAGELQMEQYVKLLSPRTKAVAVTHLSNAIGTINDVRRITAMAHDHGAAVLIDGAQWVAHYETDVQQIGCDFYAFSGHKLYGPTGIGVLYGRREWLDKLPPFQGGGDMIDTVSFEKTTYASLPNKFEAGTPHIAGAAGLAAAIDYVQSFDRSAVAEHEHQLLAYATQQLATVAGIRIIGTANEKGSVISFIVEDPPMAAFDLGMQLDRHGVACRTGHHCCMPLMDRMNIPATTRASFAMYNTRKDVDALVTALKQIRETARRNCAPAAAAPAPPKDEVDIVFPAPAGESPDAVAEELVELFEFLPDKTAKAEQIQDFTSELPAYFDILKKLTQRVPGCQAQVYLLSRRKPGEPERIEFVADADAIIVRGEIVMLQKLFSGQRADDILAFDVNRFFQRIGFENFLTQQRRTGLASMIERIRQHAKAVSTTTISNA
jgi:cysteine desulfurase / selenocysteine lyase